MIHLEVLGEPGQLEVATCIVLNVLQITEFLVFTLLQFYWRRIILIKVEYTVRLQNPHKSVLLSYRKWESYLGVVDCCRVHYTLSIMDSMIKMQTLSWLKSK